LLFAKERSGYTSQLREMALQLDGEPQDAGGDSTGSLHRVWMDFKAIFTSALSR